MQHCLLFSKSRRWLGDSQNNCHQKSGQGITHHRTSPYGIVVEMCILPTDFWISISSFSAKAQPQFPEW